jgi:alpha-L-fucosidase 2
MADRIQAVLAAGLLLACGSQTPQGGSPTGAGGGMNGGAANSSAGTSSAGSGGSSLNAGGGSAGTVSSGGTAGAMSSAGSGGSAGMSVDTSASFPALAGLYQGVFTAPPMLNDTDETTDAPLLGNGDLGVSMQNNIDTLTFILHKNEFWSLGDQHVESMARLSLAIPGMAGASYSAKEQIGSAEVDGSFTLNGQTITTKSWVQGDDATHNPFVTEFTYTGTGTQDVTVSLAVGSGNTNPATVGSMADVLYIDVRADGADKVGNYDTHRVRVATRLVGSAGTAANNQLKFTLKAGQSYALVTSVMSNTDDAGFQMQAPAAVSALAQTDVDAMLTRHQAWWDAFYRKSFIEIPNKVVEKEYYASLYLLASTSRTGEAAPGLWGNWVMKSPAWNGDYTLNYNYEAPFYASFPTNHVDLADSYDQPVIDWVPNAQAEATQNGFTGAFYRVHIGPLPNGSGDKNEWNQKSCGAFAVTDMLMHYYYTADPTYGSAIYPTLKQLATFWQNYLTKDGTRYVIENDAQHEGNAYPQTNGIMSLGLVRFLLQGSIDLSTALNMDADQRAIWQDRLTNLSAYPTFTMSGKTVFRYTEVGLDWNNGNAIGSQVIYPASQIGLASDATLLQTAQNMVAVMARWDDDNGTNTFYPAAARVGSDPTALLGHLQEWITNHTYPNLHIHTGGGGIENFNTVPSTVTEMLLQSFQGKLRLFSDWPSAVDARFGDLRAYGAFLVSSDVRKNAVQYVRIISERGGTAVLLNPWPTGTVHVYRNGADAGTMTGTELSLDSAAGEIIHLAPDGTSYQSILDEMKLPLSGAMTQ